MSESLCFGSEKGDSRQQKSARTCAISCVTKRVRFRSLKSAADTRAAIAQGIIAQRHANRKMPPAALIWQSRNLPSLPFMFSPVTDFLIAAFSRDFSPVTFGSGTKRNHSAAFHANVSTLRRGDVFVWVGPSMAQAPWSELGARGVRRIVYQTEPVHYCAARCVGRYAVDELWDFSHHNLEACQPAVAPEAPKVLRYVPPGAVLGDAPLLRAPSSSSSSSFSDLQATRAAVQQPLFFFGNPSDGRSRKACFNTIRKLLGERLEFTFAAFNEERWHSTVLSRSNIFLNLHKDCSEPHNPITFRVPKLVDSGRLVLSERAHLADEREWEGIVLFYDNVSSLAEGYLDLIATGAWVEKAKAANAAFKRRFSPARIFRRAGIVEDLVRGRSAATKA